MSNCKNCIYDKVCEEWKILNSDTLNDIKDSYGRCDFFKADKPEIQIVAEPFTKTVNVEDDFETILICAVRYAVGRQTYMPKLVVDYITPLLPYLEKRTLAVLHKDLTEPDISYGNEIIDKPLWINFISNIKKEMKERDFDA